MVWVLAGEPYFLYFYCYYFILLSRCVCIALYLNVLTKIIQHKSNNAKFTAKTLRFYLYIKAIQKNARWISFRFKGDIGLAQPNAFVFETTAERPHHIFGGVKSMWWSRLKYAATECSVWKCCLPFIRTQNWIYFDCGWNNYYCSRLVVVEVYGWSEIKFHKLLSNIKKKCLTPSLINSLSIICEWQLWVTWLA